MTFTLNYKLGFILLTSFLLINNISAQDNIDPPKSDLSTTILKLDSNFWNSYNTCDIEVFKTFFTKDLEFYHDKGGLTSTSSKLMEEVAEGLCGDKNSVLRREAIEGSVNIYPLNNYGAIITGEHLFYLRENGQREKLVEKAKFTHVWKLENELWKMSRVISYDHQPVSENYFKNEIKLSTKTLSMYVGDYQAPESGLIKIQLLQDGFLNIDAGQMKAQLHSEKDNFFFIKEAPISIEFVKNEKGKVIKFIVSENGTPVEEAKRIN